MYDKLQCKATNCKGGKGKTRTFNTINREFIKQLPYPVSDDFNYIFPIKGPGIHIDMIKTFSIFTDKHVLFSAFANAINNLQWENYYKRSNAYYYLLDKWIKYWPSVDEYNKQNIDHVPFQTLDYD